MHANPPFLLPPRSLPARIGKSIESIVFVNNQIGCDESDGQSHPVQTLQRAFDLAPVSARIEIADTGIPYHGGNILKTGGTPKRPLIVNGNGTSLTGLETIPFLQWELRKPGIFTREFWPMSNQLKINPAYTHWIGVPQIWWLDRSPAPNCGSLEKLRDTPGGFYWQKATRQVWFHLPEGRTIEEVEVSLPVRKSGLVVIPPANHVRVENLHSEFSWDDGFGAAGDVKDLTFRNCVATDNCGQGFSMHNTSEVVVEDCHAERNASSGTCDVHSCRVTYRRCVFVRNSFEAGIHTTDDAKVLYEDCRIIGNEPFEQIWQRDRSRITLLRCHIEGNTALDRALIRAENGRIELTNCTLTGASRILDVRGEGTLCIQNCEFDGNSGPAPFSAKK